MTVRQAAVLQGKSEHDMWLIRVLQQVNTPACNWDCPWKPSQERPGICTIATDLAHRRVLHATRPGGRFEEHS